MDTTQLLKGVLDLAVLAAVQHEDGYGYDIVRRLRAAGLEEVGDASVYGTLRRLYGAGALSSYVVPSDGGPHRKYYGINAEGRTMLAAQRADFAAFSATMAGLLDAPPETALPKIGATR
ncbi:PadR family transcriptional regulator [Homoserinibacter sp. YIM 151385]|uniref:PadR family transcriptional regulator n=1 Tax=Homoserinibacter sp. YIM 151385 TaxID=2985506 RepID=UPI0022F08595|nr:PadR family transcriptional regulator [Homoserinibacter sp. YIM 151385]WBU39239.1 PadR family transcriptional regulator [Homoserinibacter sp. YIM 151385]